MSFLQILWFVLIGVLFAGFFFLDGFDFGVGMATRSLAHNEEERTQIIETIGPVWDGNEVWLITAGGAMFASFPYWYATLFSGYYLILLVILVGLIIRGVSFEFRAADDPKKQHLWSTTLALGSLLVPFFLGVMFVSMIQGMPIDAQGNMHASFFDYFNWLSLVGGVALVLLTYLHGLNYIALKTVGAIRERARNYAEFLYWILYAGLVVFALLLFFNTDFFAVHPLGTSVTVLAIVFFAILGHVATFKGNEMLAFISSGLTMVALVAMIFIGMFPRVMISSISSKFDLLIQNSSSTSYTLTVMTIATVCLLPFILAYTIWAYWIFRKRIALPVIQTAEVK
ncbi:cytochrome d ubiquinol oxidase subunit II [Ligilactobacillus faecis]|uniref:Cytochrome d ubiquinol oxidase subunit II n=1 Tax=Ligilactobacillus faecis TaxID=762833 RepID=A0ABV4DMN0_9LACO|nr:cytochrome d ubiquinol oxidase subunit II [Ligilactobacillus faecis]WGN88697.1 cytochrome d ubiquinol oxidase subunit II [Ligilactobacillus faecis]